MIIFIRKSRSRPCCINMSITLQSENIKTNEKNEQKNKCKFEKDHTI